MITVHKSLKMGKKYEPLDMEIVVFDTEDIVCVSSKGTDDETEDE